ncbi:ankyrin repeat-containing domain protein [Trichoderma austrokoningii]
MDKRPRLGSQSETDQSSFFAAKRQRVAIRSISHATRYQPKDYTVSWICALHTEMAAASAMLDCFHDDLPRTPNDINTYTLGSIGHHNVVIASLPSGYYGTNNAATVASNIERSFPSIEIHLMVGIGGGAPGKLDLRLGDIVVGSRVMQYDLGKIIGDGQIERTGFSIIPPPKLLTYITKLRAIHELTPTRVPDILQEMHNKHQMMTVYAHPNAPDRLFRADFEHNPGAASCDECDASMLVHRPPRANIHPKIHYQAIASSNQVMKHGLTRDKIAQELHVACFEMEAAGLINFPYLIIRGICDYSDSHKNKQWQEYAAATAAAYAKEFLNIIPATREISQAAVQHIEALSPTNAVVSFFFNARGDVLEKSTTGMYRSLLLQLLERFPDLKTVCEDPNFGVQSGNCPSSEDIQTLFRTAISVLGRRSLTCFIDALDECDEQQILDMVQYFETLGQQAVEYGIELRICFSSRHYPYIFIRQGLRLTLEDQEGHEEDVQKYVQGNLRVEQGSVLEDIKGRILQKAAGVFMWVVLVVDILNKEFSRGRMFAVEKRFEEIPNRLGDLFKDILKRDNDNMEDLLLSIQWILYAERPLLREEFYFAVSTGIMDEEDLTPEYLTSSIPSDMMDKFVVSSSKGLAEATKSKQRTVQFIHESVRDFLIKDNGFQELWPEFGYDFESPSHDKLKQCCYKYLKPGITHLSSYGALPKKNEDIKVLCTTVSQQVPFLQYATQHLLYHAEVAARNIPQDNFLAEFKLEDWITAHNLFQKLKKNRLTAKASLFYVLADKGYSSLIQTRLHYDSKYYKYGERYSFPVFAALVNGHGDAAQALLNPAVDGCYQDDHVQANEIWEDGEEFVLAAAKGWKPIVELFIERGIDVNYTSPNLSNEPALTWAAIYGCNDIVELLIEHGANINSRGSFGRTALIKTIHLGKEDAALFLLERGADINDPGATGLTPLMHAIDYRRKGQRVIRWLIENGADVNSKSSYVGGNWVHLWTPLFYAIERKCDEDIIQLLIKKGTNIHHRDSTGDTALQKSFRGKLHYITKILIENGADSSLIGIEGNTPQERLAAFTIMKKWIMKGAEIESLTGFTSTLVYSLKKHPYFIS